MVKASKEVGDFKYIAFCGVESEFFSTTYSKVKINCPDCMAGLILKKEQELELLHEWRDASLIRLRVNRGSDG